MAIRRTKAWNEAMAVLTKNVQDAVIAAGVITQREIKAELNKGKSNRGATPSAPGSPPHRDTGSLGYKLNVDNSNARSTVRPFVRVGSNLPYARIHEFGGVITAKKGYLPIPLNQVARDMQRRAGGSLRNVGGLSTIRSKKGNLLLGRFKRGKGKAYGKGRADNGFEPLFVLKKSVRMPARPYMRPAFRRAKPKILNLFRARGLLAGFRGAR
jgi:phage gpG-like protein